MIKVKNMETGFILNFESPSSIDNHLSQNYGYTTKHIKEQDFYLENKIGVGYKILEFNNHKAEIKKAEINHNLVINLLAKIEAKYGSVNNCPENSKTLFALRKALNALPENNPNPFMNLIFINDYGDKFYTNNLLSLKKYYHDDNLTLKSMLEKGYHVKHTYVTIASLAKGTDYIVNGVRFTKGKNNHA